MENEPHADDIDYIDPEIRAFVENMLRKAGHDAEAIEAIDTEISYVCRVIDDEIESLSEALENGDVDEEPIGFAPGGTPIYRGDDR